MNTLVPGDLPQLPQRPASSGIGGHVHMRDAIRRCRRCWPLLEQGNVWGMLSNGHRVSTWPGCEEAIPVAKALIAANSERLIWGTDWPHPLHEQYMPNDADLLELFYRYTDGDQALRRKMLVDNPTALFFSN